FKGTEVPEGELLVAVETESVNPNPADVAGKTVYGKNQKETQEQMMQGMKKNNNVPAAGGDVYGSYVKIPEKYNNPKTSGLRTKGEFGQNKIKIELTE